MAIALQHASEYIISQECGKSVSFFQYQVSVQSCLVY